MTEEEQQRFDRFIANKDEEIAKRSRYYFRTDKYLRELQEDAQAVNRIGLYDNLIAEKIPITYVEVRDYIHEFFKKRGHKGYNWNIVQELTIVIEYSNLLTKKYIVPTNRIKASKIIAFSKHITGERVYIATDILFVI